MYIYVYVCVYICICISLCVYRGTEVTKLCFCPLPTPFVLLGFEGDRAKGND